MGGFQRVGQTTHLNPMFDPVSGCWRSIEQCGQTQPSQASCIEISGLPSIFTAEHWRQWRRIQCHRHRIVWPKHRHEQHENPRRSHRWTMVTGINTRQNRGKRIHCVVTGIFDGKTYHLHRQKQITPWINKGLFFHMAENEGFEPSIQVLPVCTLSRGVPSAARPILRWEECIIISIDLPVKQFIN